MIDDHASRDLRDHERNQDRAFQRGDDFDRELSKRLRDPEYRRPALGHVLADDDEAFLHVWALMQDTPYEVLQSLAGDAGKHAAIRALNDLIDKQIESDLDLEFTRLANEEDAS